MAIRVYKLAKELGVTSKDVIAEAVKHGIDIPNHMGSLSEAEANMIRAFLYDPDRAPKPETEEAPADEVVEAAPVAVEAEPLTAPAEATAPASTGPIEIRIQGAPQAPVEEPPEPQAVPAPEVAEPAAEIADVMEEPFVVTEEPAVAAQEPAADVAPTVPEVTVTAINTGGIRAAIVNPGEESAVTEAESAEVETVEAKPVEIKQVSVGPTSGRTVVSSQVQPDPSKPVKELPKRRTGTILGHKEIAVKDRQQRSAPVVGNEGMTQVGSSGSKRTFVRTPHRGGGGGGGGGPRYGGGGGGGGPRGRGRGGNRGPLIQRPKSKPTTPVERPSEIEIQLPITVKDLSAAMAVKTADIIKKLMGHGMFAKINDTLDKETVELIGLEFECIINVGEAKDLEKAFTEEEVEAFEDSADDVMSRPPIVAMLGHVDHGKTSLLDRIRETRIAEREHGGITQHTGASRVETSHGDIVFLDTPGHRAFTEMRARGANITDVVVLVVAADDGVMPQTEEAISHAKAAGTPIVVAMNKCDKPEANPDRVKQQLAGHGLQSEDWGGDTGFFEVSAMTGEGIDKLIEYIGLMAELLELEANPKRPGHGTVLEALQKKGEGNVIRMVTTNGSIHRGDNFICGSVFGKIKTIRTSKGLVNEAGPGWPVEITGMSELPLSGDQFHIIKDVNRAKQLAEERQERAREQRLADKRHVNLENLLAQQKTGRLNIIVKADTQGTLEVLKQSIGELAHDEIEPKIIHSAVGGVTETDITLADASDAVVLGFHVTDTAEARRLADEKGVDVRLYYVIYKLLDELKEALEGRLAPEEKEIITGHVEVRQVFKISRIGVIAGCKVMDGIVRRTSGVRLTRNGILIHEGRIETLRHIKDDVKEVKEGSECGIRIEGYNDLKVGDIIEPFEVEKIRRTLGT